MFLIDTSGVAHAVEFAADGQWQQDNIALIDLEDGQANCLNGTPGRNAHAHGTIDRSDFVALRFTVGVPFELNHANPLQATAPLNDSAMHWHWRSGYKFLRAGVTAEGDGTWLHLGSTACHGTVQNISACAAANRVVVELEDFSPATSRVAVDLSALFSGIDLQDGVRSDCSSSPAEMECATMFGALGLVFGNNEARGNSVFRVMP